MLCLTFPVSMKQDPRVPGDQFSPRRVRAYCPRKTSDSGNRARPLWSFSFSRERRTPTLLLACPLPSARTK